MSDLVERLRSIGNQCVALGYASLRHNYFESADEIERLRGLLREVHEKHWPFLTDGLHERVYDAINGAAVQPTGVTSWMCTCGKANSEYRDRCENCGGMETWTRAAAPTDGAT